jgi:hypothetical protein
MDKERSGERMKLGAFFHPTGNHVAAWLHPDAQIDAGTNFRHYAEITQTAERGKFDLMFVADAVATRDGKLEALSRWPQYMAFFDPGESAFRDRKTTASAHSNGRTNALVMRLAPTPTGALLLRLAEIVCRQTAGWRQSQASAGTRESQLAFDHGWLAAHENVTGPIARRNRLILAVSAPQQCYFTGTKTRCRSLTGIKL